MALSINFLAATSKNKNLQDIMSSKSANKVSTAKSNVVSNVFQNKKSEESEKTQNSDLSNMSTSDLISHVYNNQKQDNNDIKLPISVEYGKMDFATSGKQFDDVVKEIESKTGDSKSKIESELKRNYGSATGGSLNMQA